MVEKAQAVGCYEGSGKVIRLWVMGEPDGTSITYQLDLEQTSKLIEELTDSLYGKVFRVGG